MGADVSHREERLAGGPGSEGARPDANPPAPVAELPQTRFSHALDSFLTWVGGLVSWLWIAILLIIVINVIWRYVLRNNMGQLEELQWHLYSIAFLVGLSYCVVSDSHVRIDILYGSFGLRAKAWVDFFGILLFAFPFIAVVIWYGIPFTVQSFNIGEVSEQPSGLPYRYLIKGVLVVAFALLGLAMLSRLARVTAFLFGFPRPLPAAGFASRTAKGE